MPAPEAIAARAPSKAALRTAAVQEMARLLRLLFEVEREFVRTASTIIPRVGAPELKYLLCQHIWESAGHARFLRERGRELTGFGASEEVRPEIRRIFEEAVLAPAGLTVLAAFYGVLKPALLRAYRHYLQATHHLADWPSRRLVEEFVADEERHAAEMRPWVEEAAAASPWVEHIALALRSRGDWLGEAPVASLPATFSWESSRRTHQHPPVCSREGYPVCSSVFGEDPDETPIVRSWLADPGTDARVIRLMVYVWLMMEMDAVDYLATVLFDTPAAPFDLHHDLARHLWDESRHSQFGYRQLPRLGVDLRKLEHSLELYQILVQMAPHERYAMMTMEFEAGSFPTKAHVMDRVRELNDFEADTLLAFDRNDEQNHVRYGHRWLPEMMRLAGETRPVEDFVRETRARFSQLAETWRGLPPHSLPPEERVTGTSLRRLALAGGPA